MKSSNWMNILVVGALSIGLFSCTAPIQAMAQELPKVYDASMPGAADHTSRERSSSRGIE